MLVKQFLFPKQSENRFRLSGLAKTTFNTTSTDPPACTRSRPRSTITTSLLPGISHHQQLRAECFRDHQILLIQQKFFLTDSRQASFRISEWNMRPWQAKFRAAPGELPVTT